MCTILLAWRCIPAAPVVLAANRDELVGRPSTPPGLLQGAPAILGGRDLTAGGTWLALAGGGRICAVTNRHPAPGLPVDRDPNRRSRGEIPIEVLSAVTDERDLLAALGGRRYNPVNVLFASPERALVAHVDDTGGPRLVELSPGPHVLTVGDVDDHARPKVAMLAARLDGALSSSTGSRALVEGMRSILALHITPDGEPAGAPCIHGDVYGTVSSSTVTVADGGVEYWHSPGRPCVTPYLPVDTTALSV